LRRTERNTPHTGPGVVAAHLDGMPGIRGCVGPKGIAYCFPSFSMENNKTGALYALCASVVKRLIAQSTTTPKKGGLISTLKGCVYLSQSPLRHRVFLIRILERRILIKP